MDWKTRAGLVTAGAALAVLGGAAASGAAFAAPAGGLAITMKPPLVIKVLGHTRDGKPVFASTVPTGLGPSVIAKVYHLSGMSPSSGAGKGQVIAVVDAFRDKTALADLNTFNTQYGYPQLSTCTSLTQAGPCFKAYNPQGTPSTNRIWNGEESLDIEWAHAEAPAAKIVLVQTKDAFPPSMFMGVTYAGTTLKATEVSMSWDTPQYAGETSYDSAFTHPGTLYTGSSGDYGHYSEYPAAAPNVIAVGGTTLKGCGGTSCPGTVHETAWSGSGGGISTFEKIAGYQSSYTGAVSGAATVNALTGGKRGIPDVSFDANPATGVSVYSSAYGGWLTLGGTSVSAPNWAGILAAGASAGKTALQGDSAIYSGGYKTNLRDITSGSNGGCGTDCRAGKGYDLVTGLGSPINYP
ncbi:MAG TPA: S53 family peptidase [Streptosporangiaceae bacterium]|nr:S53 family peptidase [Streptosporangiaceae bacterium]